MNYFGCLACDLSLAVFSIFLSKCTFKQRLLLCLITSEEGFNQVNVNIEHRALQCKFSVSTFLSVIFRTLVLLFCNLCGENKEAKYQKK